MQGVKRTPRQSMENLESLTTEDDSFWRLVRAARDARKKIPMSGPEGIVYMPKEKWEIFGGSIFKLYLRETLKMARRTWRSKCDKPLRRVPIAEVEKVIAARKNGKTPAKDGITNNALKKFMPRALWCLVGIIYGTIALNHCPTNLKMFGVLMISKEGKDPRHAENYRSISLLPNLSNILEY